MVASVALLTVIAPMVVRQARTKHIAAKSKAPRASSLSWFRADNFCVKKSTLMLLFRIWHQGTQREIAIAIPICVSSTSPCMGFEVSQREITL